MVSSLILNVGSRHDATHVEGLLEDWHRGVGGKGGGGGKMQVAEPCT